MTRTDLHRPSAIEPVDYVHVGEFYQGASDEIYVEYKHEHADLEAAVGQDWHEATAPGGNYATKGTCDHCGTGFAYGSVYRHVPSGDLIAVGHICAAKTLLPGLDQAARAKAAAARAAKAAKTAKANLAYRATLLFSVPGLAEALATEGNDFVVDVARRFGSAKPELSEKQVLAVIAAAARQRVWNAEKAAEQALASPVETGKGVAITGVALSVKWKDSDFGGSWRMVVKDDRGFKVWGTVPSALDVKAGDRVTFTANVEASEDDETFGFFKRPRKSANLSEEIAV